jgi:uncharacterized protein (TIGR02246 family)
MSRRAAPPPAADTPDEVEAGLYDALRRGDLEALMALWADDEDIVCIHPGGGRVVGAAAIRASFGAIFSGGRGIPVQPEQVHRLQQLAFALHHLVERIEIPGAGGRRQLGWVLSSNVYVKTPAGWRLVAHHASPGLPGESAESGEDRSLHGADAPSTLH